MRISFPFSIFVCSGGLSGTLELKVVRFWLLIVAFVVVFLFSISQRRYDFRYANK